ncbi:Csu type fimbrial protein [Salinicola socius]|uniref:Spore coat protein U/FanG domain-containing protein n=1 Tax=Salinicola socius TaxID=404433 RepID=A0A1Q8SU38_9GAMM|nr:spore coat U domain-containing protein [Salinicola socius]OLO04933.1 hypothetical protein BTW07_06840 [Salinicola socius]
MRTALIGAVSVWLSLGTAMAQSLPQSSFQVSATITEGCLVNGTGQSVGNVGELGQLDFGTASALSEAVQVATFVQTGGVVLDCTPGIALTLRVDGGLHASGGTRQLARTGGGASLTYTLFADAGLQQPIGIDEPVSFDLAEGATTVALPIYGRLALPGNAAAGSYTDRLTVTLEW